MAQCSGYWIYIRMIWVEIQFCICLGLSLTQIHYVVLKATGLCPTSVGSNPTLTTVWICFGRSLTQIHHAF